MHHITIRRAGPYAVTTDGSSIYLNSKPARILPAPRGSGLAQVVDTGAIDADGKRVLVGLSAKQLKIHRDLHDARADAFAAAYLATPEGQAEAARRAAEIAYDLHDDNGGEGYNPHRSGSRPTYR